MTLSAPGPSGGLPWLGPNLAKLRFARDPLGRMSELFEQYGDVVSLARSGGTQIFSSHPNCPGTIFGRGPEFLRAVELDHKALGRSATSGRLFPHNKTGPRNQALREWGTGLFAVNEDEHAHHRRMLSPPFSRASVEGWVPAFAEVTGRIASSWELGEVVDIHDAMKDITLRIVTRSLFGEELGRASALAIAQEQSLLAMISPGVLAARVDLPGFPYRRFLDHAVTLSQEAHELVARRREEGADGPDVLSTLIRASAGNSDGMTDAQIVGHAGVMMAAGHETTAFACSFVLFLLSQHPAVASDVVDEIKSVLRGATPGPAELRSMPLLENVILEALRLMPPAPWTAREASCQTSILGFDLEPGTELVPSIFHTHRMPEYWPDASAFKPQRWEAPQPSPYEFNPFGGGPRMCIGRNFAMMEMRAILSFLLSRFRFESCSEVPIQPYVSITMSFQGGLPMRVESADSSWEDGWKPVPGDIHRFVDLRS